MTQALRPGKRPIGRPSLPHLEKVRRGTVCVKKNDPLVGKGRRGILGAILELQRRAAEKRSR